MSKLAPILAGGLRGGATLASGGRRSSTAVTGADGAATEPAYRRMKGPHGEPVPRMHSAWIPAWQQMMRERHIAQQDDGRRLYEKTPGDRFAYRASWAFIAVGLGFTGYQLVHFMIENSPLN